MRLVSFLILLGFSAPLWAAGELEGRYGAALERCYSEAGTPEAARACIGRMMEACVQGEQGGQSTIGTMDCAGAEAQVWDKHLNIEYKATRAEMRAMDAEDADRFPEFARRAKALLTAQRAWIAFRDAECDLAYAQFGSGSFSRVAGIHCVLRLTAERTIELRAYRGEFQ